MTKPNGAPAERLRGGAERARQERAARRTNPAASLQAPTPAPEPHGDALRAGAARARAERDASPRPRDAAVSLTVDPAAALRDAFRGPDDEAAQ